MVEVGGVVMSACIVPQSRGGTGVLRYASGMNMYKGIKAWIAIALLLASGTVWAQSFRIASTAGNGWPIDVQGSATLQRQADGVLIRIDALTVTARYPTGDPLYIAALRFNGSDVTGGGERTSLMFSERVPVGQSLAPGAVLQLQISTPLFMRNPDWHQNDPRFDLAVEIRHDGQEGLIPIATTLHTLKLPSDFRRRSTSEVRNSGASSGMVAYGALLVTALLLFWGFVRWCKTPGKEAFIGFVVMVFVWMGGFYPMLLSGYSLLWTRTQAQIVDSAVREFPPSGKKTRFQYMPIVKYQYEIAGKTYSSTRLQHVSWATYTSRDEAYDSLQVWDETRIGGRAVPAWVNPLDASDAVLVRQPSIWSALLSLVGLVTLFMLWRGKQQLGA